MQCSDNEQTIPFSDSHPSMFAQPNAYIIHCDKPLCKEQIVTRLIRELKIRGLVPVEILTTVSDSRLTSIITSSDSDHAILLHICDHSKKKLKNILKSLDRGKCFKYNIFVFGHVKIEIKDFKGNYCISIQKDFDIFRLVDHVCQHCCVINQHGRDSHTSDISSGREERTRVYDNQTINQHGRDCHTPDISSGREEKTRVYDNQTINPHERDSHTPDISSGREERTSAYDNRTINPHERDSHTPDISSGREERTSAYDNRTINPHERDSHTPDISSGREERTRVYDNQTINPHGRDSHTPDIYSGREERTRVYDNQTINPHERDSHTPDISSGREERTSAYDNRTIKSVIEDINELQMRHARVRGSIQSLDSRPAARSSKRLSQRFNRSKSEDYSRRSHHQPSQLNVYQKSEMVESTRLGGKSECQTEHTELCDITSEGDRAIEINVPTRATEGDRAIEINVPTRATEGDRAIEINVPTRTTEGQHHNFCDAWGDHFIDSVFLQINEESTGSFIKESFSKSEVNCPMERKLRLYMRNPGFEEYQKDIVTRIIPELRKSQDIRKFSEWLLFDDFHTREKLLVQLENVLLNVSLQRVEISHLVQVVDNILNCYFRKVIQADDTLFLPLRVLTLCFVILHVLNCGTTDTTSYIQIQNLSARAYGDLNTVKRNPNGIVTDQLNNLTLLLEYFSKNHFQCSLVDEALSRPNYEIVLTEFVSLDYSSKFVYIFMLVNKMSLQQSQRAEILLTMVVKAIFDTMSKKQKLRYMLHPLLYIVNKGIILRLTQGPQRERNWNELKESLLLCISKYLQNSRMDLLWKGKMLECLEPLLFVADKSIVNQTINIFEKCAQKHKHIRNIIFKHVQNLLSAVNLRIFPFKQTFDSLQKPVWCEIPGKVWNDLDVSLNLLIPTVKCLASGSMEDYRKLADEKETKRHINSLEVLRVLQYERSHPNLIKLIGYQYRPLPLFYLLETHKNLHIYLQEKRQYHKWLSSAELGQMTIHMIDALQYIHSKGVIHRNLTTHSFSMNGNDRVMLHDFSLAKLLESGETNSFIHALNDEDVPVLYSAPESILEDKYDFCTDTWMLGLVICGLYTHGGEPYSIHSVATEQILEYVVFQDLKPTKWPCIPKEVFDAVMACVHSDPRDRSKLTCIRKIIEGHLVYCKSRKLSRLCSLFEMDRMYPPATVTEPERGLPPLFKMLKQEQDPRKSYFNIRKSETRPNKCCITLDELTAPDTPTIQREKHDRYLKVEEPVTKSFVEEELPQLSEHTCIRVLKMIERPTKSNRHCQTVDGFEYVLHYKCCMGESIIDFALRNHFGAPGIDEVDIMYLGLTYNLVKFVQRMHFHKWLLRDICGDSIFVDSTSLTVFMPRVGRFRKMTSSVQLDDCLLDDSFLDKMRWLPIEAIQHGLYSKESDIYMLGMTVYEFYTALEMGKDARTVNPLELKPFCTIPKTELLAELYSGEIPNMPLSCPPWLYDLLKSCWNRNRTFRPSADHLLKQIKNIIQHHPRRDRIIHMINLKPAGILPPLPPESISTHSESEETENPYLSIQHVKSCSSTESITSVTTKNEPRRKQNVENGVKRRTTPGRNKKVCEPSGNYANEPDFDFINISNKHLAPDTIIEDVETVGELQRLQLNYKNNTTEILPNIRKLSRIDSGIVDDESSKVETIPAIPVRKSNRIPSIPISTYKNNSTDCKQEETDYIILTTAQRLETQIHPELGEVGDSDPYIEMNKFNIVQCLSLENDQTTKVTRGIKSRSTLDNLEQTYHPSYFKSHPRLTTSVRSKDDLDTEKNEPGLAKFGSCYLFKSAGNLQCKSLSVPNRESYV